MTLGAGLYSKSCAPSDRGDHLAHACSRMAMAVIAAKKQLRKELKRALAAMSDQQFQEESTVLVKKVETRLVVLLDIHD